MCLCCSYFFSWVGFWADSCCYFLVYSLFFWVADNSRVWGVVGVGSMHIFGGGWLIFSFFFFSNITDNCQPLIYYFSAFKRISTALNIYTYRILPTSMIALSDMNPTAIINQSSSYSFLAASAALISSSLFITKL